MFLLACLLLAFNAVQSMSVQNWPPEPDFLTPVDYAAWFEGVVRRGEPASENAAAFYREILDAPPAEGSADVYRPPRYAGGPHYEETDGPRPWSVAERDEWKAAHAARAPLMPRFLRAAELEYVYFDVDPADSGYPSGLSPLFLEDMERSQLRPWAHAVSDHAWHAPDGMVDAAEALKLLRANLGLARQLEGGGGTLSVMSAGIVRMLVFEDFHELLRRDILSVSQRRSCLEMLRDRDPEQPPVAELLAYGLARAYDDLQYSAWPQGYPPEASEPDAERKEAATPAERAGLLAARDAQRAFHHAVARLSPQFWSPTLEARITALAREVTERHPGALASGAPDADWIAKFLRLRFLAEMRRRGIRLVCELMVFRDEHGRYPVRLGELPAEAAPFAIDPFGGEPFRYERVGDSFRLYSAGLDCHDDGGVHDRQAGLRNPNVDYMVWPEKQN